jgi:hypothetical protein
VDTFQVSPAFFAILSQHLIFGNQHYILRRGTCRNAAKQGRLCI